jgi:hypothetical protein
MFALQIDEHLPIEGWTYVHAAMHFHLKMKRLTDEGLPLFKIQAKCK